MSFHHDLGHDVTCIDVGLMQPGMTACYLLGSAGRWAFVEAGTTRSVPRLLAVLAAKGIDRDQVDYVIPTHVHLDHAGGAGQLMQALPNARALLHPRGAPHMIDPTRLIEGAAAVYGRAWLDEHYGPLVPVPAERVVTAGDGLELDLGRRRLRFVHTEGHARHHFAVWDEASRGFFTGDTFGLSLRDFDGDRGPFLYLPSAPVQFDPAAWHATVDRLLAYRPDCVYLTHFGRLEGVAALGRALHEQIDRSVAIARAVAAAADRAAALRRALTVDLLARLEEHGCTLARERILTRLGMDIEINAQGLEVWLDGAGA
jgi:glyoxylase-like metal-dependent hydrolase (beta-lactamase superfamily II)